MGKQPQIVEIKMAAVEAMVERAKGLLAKEDHDLLKGLVDTLLTLVGLVRKGRTTIARLRRLVGMVSTEKTTEVLGKLSEGEASAADGTAGPAEHNEEKPAAENNAAAGDNSLRYPGFHRPRTRRPLTSHVARHTGLESPFPCLDAR